MKDSGIRDFIITKSILERLNISIDDIGVKETRYLLYPLEYIKGEKGSSLTLLQSYDSQLRYPMIDRAKKYLRLLANQIKTILPLKLIVSVDNLDEIFEGDKIFIDYLSQYTEIVLEITNSKNDNTFNFLCLDENTLNDMGLKYMSSGNSWTARNIYSYLVDVYNKPEYILNLAAAYNQLYEVEKAEYYLELARKLGDKNIIIEANYMLAMLFARHHKKHLLNDSYSKALLNEAYSYFGDEVTINKIFNRNGYALLLFKERRVDDAISMLKECINSLIHLKKISNDSAIEIHESVLVYNVLQCYFSKKNHNQVDKYFRKLELLDPNFLEYKIEYARYLLENGSK
ncbi:TPA: tetratricopeptide repeat protein, partial [Streptococcus suis]